MDTKSKLLAVQQTFLDTYAGNFQWTPKKVFFKTIGDSTNVYIAPDEQQHGGSLFLIRDTAGRANGFMFEFLTIPEPENPTVTKFLHLDAIAPENPITDGTYVDLTTYTPAQGMELILDDTFRAQLIDQVVSYFPLLQPTDTAPQHIKELVG